MNLGPEDIVRLSLGRVLVVGDVMVDHYVSGAVVRVSDEAPVPILCVDHERWTPGGAANVAANIAALGGHARLIGVLGEDAAGEKLAALLKAEGCAVDAQFVRDPERPTTLKTRYMGGQHQIVRVDREQNHPLDGAAETRVIDAITASTASVHAIVLSDYAKGALTPRVLEASFSHAKKVGALTLVDPKRTDWSAYRGADFITPNRRELQAATGHACASDDDCARAAERAIAMTGAAILLTRSEKGISLFRPGVAPLHLPARAREVFDVSGAGDTVAAAFALSLAAGVTPDNAVALANLAAGVVVAKRGTATASQEELSAALGAERFAQGASRSPSALDLDDAVALRRRWEREGLSVGFTNGCFDLLHPGHISLLRQAATACDRLIVGLNADASVKRLKGPSRPVQTEAARAAVIAAIKGVDAVVVFGEETPLRVIEAIAPDVLIKGADYAETEIVGAAFVRGRGGRIVRADLVAGQSTTRMISEAGGSLSAGGGASLPASDLRPSFRGDQEAPETTLETTPESRPESRSVRKS